MRKNIKKALNLAINTVMVFLLLFNLNVVKAATAVHLSLLVDDYNPTLTDWDASGVDYGESEYEKADGSVINLNTLTNGSKIKAGQVLRVNVMLDFKGGTTTNSNFDLFMSYDKSQLTYLKDPDNNVVYQEMTESKGKNFDGNSDYYGIFPAKGSSGANKTSTDWNFGGGIAVAAQYSTAPGRTFVAMPTLQAGSGNKVLNGKGIIVALYFKVNADVAPGTTVMLDLPTKSRIPGNNIFASTSIGLTSESLSLVVEGDAPAFDATLASLTATANNHNYMESKFNASKESYTGSDSLVVPYQVSSITLAASTANTTSGLVLTYGKKGVSGSNAVQNLSVGDNELYVVVSSTTGQEKIYTLNVKRLDNTASISAVSGTYGSSALTFDGNLKGNVPSSTTAVKIIASTQGASTVITSGGNVLSGGNLSITGETTTFVVSVTPENALSQYASVYGNTPSSVVNKTYTITRQNGDTALKSITVDGVEYYSSGKTSYSVPVLSNATTSNVVVTANHAKATVDLYASPYSFTQSLSTGNTTKTFKVTAEDGTSQNYSILFERQKDTNADLTSLQATINGQSLISNFNASTLNYDLGEIAYIEGGTISVSAQKSSSKATLTGTVSNKTLAVGKNSVSITVTAENGTKKVYTVSVTMKPSTNAVISDGIKIGGENAVDQGIVDNKHQYSVSVPYSKTEVSMSDFTISLPNGSSIKQNDGTKALIVGENTYQFVVVAGDGSTTETYRVVITRRPSANALLSDLKIVGDAGGVISPSSFNSQTTNYTYSVPATTQSFTVSAVAKEEGVVEASGVGTFNLTSADVTHTVKVTSQDGTATKTYSIRILRSKSDIKTLESLTLNGDDILSLMVNHSYTTTVLNDVTQAVFDYSLSDPKSTATINGLNQKTFNLQHGVNNFSIVVVAENQTTQTYTITITRERNNEARLSELKVNQQMISAFASDTLDYTLADVANEVASIEVSAIAIDSDATLQISSTQLVVGANTITVKVIAADGKTTKNYRIFVTRLKSDSSQIISIAPTAQAAAAGHVMSKESDTKYIVQVPYGITEYSQSFFNLSVLSDSTINYPEQPVQLKNNDHPVFTFNVTSPLGLSKTTYEIEIVTMKSLYPLLNGVSINGKEISSFDRDTFSQPSISADAYLADHQTLLNVEWLVDNDVSVVGGKSVVINVGGKLTTTKSVLLQKGSYSSTYNFTFTHTLSKDTSLKTLSSNVGNLDIGLEDNVDGPFEINVAQDVSSITFVAQATASSAKLTGLGPYTDLKPGKNIKTIYVTPEDGSQAKAYTIVVNRSMALASLKVAGQTLDVSSGTVENGVLVFNVKGLLASDSTAQITATANDSSVTMSGDVNKMVKIAKGQGTLNFTLTSQDGLSSLKVRLITERAASSDARLKTLSVTLAGQSLESSFDPDQESYDLKLPYTVSLIDPSKDFEWTTVHENATVSAPSAFALSDLASTTMEIKTTAEDGTQKTYKVNITKAGYNYLSALSVGQGEGILNETFTFEKQNYTATIYPEVETFRIYYAVDTNYAGTYVENEEELKQIQVSELPKTVEVRVVASNGEKRTYSIAIDTGLSARLSALVPSVGNIEFSPNTTDYRLEVAENVNSISFTPTAEDTKATITGNYTNVSLSKEVTEVSIQVKNGNYEKIYRVQVVKLVNETALDSVDIKQSGKTWTPVYDATEKKYVAEVERGVDLMNIEVVAKGVSNQTQVQISEATRVSDNEAHYTIISTDKNGNTMSYDVVVRYVVSDNNYLKSINVKGQPLKDFIKEKTDYTYEISDDQSFEVSAIAEDSLAKVKVNYPQSFGDQAKITIDVTSEKGTTRTYTLTLQRKLSSNALLLSLSVLEGTLSPQFYELVNDYYVNVANDVSEVHVSATVQENATYEVIGHQNLKEGVNLVEVVVTAENKTQNTYKIYVTRTASLNNPLTQIKVVGEIHGEYSLSPSFVLTQRNYTVLLERDEQTVDVQVVVKDNLRVTGEGTTTITQFPEVKEIHVFNSENDEEVYTITFKQKPSSNANLSNLWTDKGYLDQVFSASKNDYTLSVDHDIEEIELLYTLSEAGQKVEGGGRKTLAEGRNRFNIVVSAEDNTTQTYTVTIIRGSKTGPQLTTLSVSEGELSPKFKPTTLVYYVQVDQNIEKLLLTAEGSNGSTVTGAGEVQLKVGSNTFEVKVNDDQAQTTYTVVINRGRVSSVYLSRFYLEGYPSQESFDKMKNDYTTNIHSGSNVKPKLVAIAEDPTATVSVDVPSEIGQGQHQIKATVTLPSGESKTYTMLVDVFVYKIRSSVHTVGEIYIPTIHAERTVSDVKGEMLNQASTLQLFNNGEKLADDALVPSGTVMKLVVNGVTYDQKTLIVLGDANRDGRIGVGDVQVIQTYVLGKEHDEVSALTADTNKDLSVGVGDVIAVRSHILKTYNLYGEGE